jgi:hypothetical protein
LTLFDCIVLGFCFSLPFAVWAIRRWRVRVYVSRERNFHPTQSRPVNGVPTGASEAKDSPQRARPFVVPRPQPFLVQFDQERKRSGNVVGS